MQLKLCCWFVKGTIHKFWLVMFLAQGQALTIVVLYQAQHILSVVKGSCMTPLKALQTFFTLIYSNSYLSHRKFCPTIGNEKRVKIVFRYIRRIHRQFVTLRLIKPLYPKKINWREIPKIKFSWVLWNLNYVTERLLTELDKCHDSLLFQNFGD